MERKEETDGRSGLTPYVTPFQAWALSFGCAVGWGAFAMPGTTFLPVAGPWGTLIGMVIGTAAMLVVGMNYHVMMNCCPGAGGVYTYTKRMFGYDHGFFCAWFISLAYIAILWANATALAILGRRLLGGMFQVGYHYQVAGFDVYFGEVLMSIAAVLLCGLLCICCRRTAVRVQAVCAVALMVGVLYFFAAVMGIHEGGLESFEPAFAPQASSSLTQVFSIVLMAPWAFLGFESISHSTREFAFPAKKSIGIMAASVLAGCIAYALLSVVAIAYLPATYGNWTAYLSNLGHLEGIASLPTFYAIHAALGKGGMWLLALVVLSAILTGIIGNYVAASRLLYSMAQDNVIPPWFGKLNGNHVPRNALLFILLLSLAVPFLGRAAIGWIVDVTTVGASIAYAYTSAAAYRVSKAEGNRMGKWTGLLGIGISACFLLFLMVPNFWSNSALAAESYLILVFWSVLGFVCFREAFRRDTEGKLGTSVVAWISMLFLIFFASQLWIRQSTQGTMEQIVENVSDFYRTELENHGIHRSIRQEREEMHVDEQLDSIHSSLMNNSAAQMILISISLCIMFNIFSTMRGREKRMELQKIQAEENSKAKTQFLSNMSHDIRTPMNAIVGYINLAKKEKEDPAVLQEYLAKIESSSQHLLALINDILEMSRIESGKMDLSEEDADLVRILDEVRDMFATQMEEKGIRFTVDASSVQHPYVHCDKNRLNRVLLNLVSNAYKFTLKGGSISIVLEEPESRLDGRGVYEFRVKDTGIGMSEEFAQKVFEAFEREQNSTVSGIQGTGLGMAITKSIVHLMNGSIRVESEKGKGTEFFVRLCFDLSNPPTAEAAPAHALSEKSVDFSGKRLLLVDDLEVNREIAKMLLMEAGFAVDTAVNGQDALDKVAASKPGDYDAVLMDVQMPIMDGYEATRRIRELHEPMLASVPILAMTANAFSEDIQAAKDAGMNGHISKPIDVSKMMKALAEVLH